MAPILPRAFARANAGWRLMRLKRARLRLSSWLSAHYDVAAGLTADISHSLDALAAAVWRKASPVTGGERIRELLAAELSLGKADDRFPMHPAGIVPLPLSRVAVGPGDGGGQLDPGDGTGGLGGVIPVGAGVDVGVPGVGVRRGDGVAECDGLAGRERLAVREGLGDRVGADDGVTAGPGVVGAGAGFTPEPVWAVLAGTGRTRM